MKWSKEEDKLLKKIYPFSTNDELFKVFKRSVDSIQRRANRLKIKKEEGFYTKNYSSLKLGEVMEMDMSKLKEKELLEEISRRGFMSTKREIRQELSYPIELGQAEKIGIVSDTHIGSCYQQLTHLRRFYTYCQSLGITKIFHGGDVVEGSGKLFKGQIYEMFLHGSDSQIGYTIENYPKAGKIKTYMIGGSHDYSFYKDIGYDILEAIAEKRKDIHYLGMNGAFLKVGNISIYLMHGSGGVAYARSYRIQKIIEQMSPEQKPHILLLGHYHVPCWLPGYRNVEGLQLPCFQAQTPYMKGKGLFPFIGGIILEFTHDKTGLTSFKPEIVPFYKVVQGDF